MRALAPRLVSPALSAIDPTDFPAVRLFAILIIDKDIFSLNEGSTANDTIGSTATILTNGNYIVQSENWDCQTSLGCSGTIADVGAVTWGNGTTGIAGPVSTANSLVGSTAGDQIGSVIALSNGNYAASTRTFDSASTTDIGLAFIASGSYSMFGIIPK